MTASASVATTPENLGSMLGETGCGGKAPLALTNGSDTGGTGKGPSLEALVDILKSGNTGAGGTPVPKAKGKAKAKAKAMVTRDTSKATGEQLADIRSMGPQLK